MHDDTDRSIEVIKQTELEHLSAGLVPGPPSSHSHGAFIKNRDFWAPTSDLLNL